jgi:hypothetical protein
MTEDWKRLGEMFPRSVAPAPAQKKGQKPTHWTPAKDRRELCDGCHREVPSQSLQMIGPRDGVATEWKALCVHCRNEGPPDG